MPTLLNMSDLIMGSTSSVEILQRSEEKRASKIRWSKTKRRIVVYTGVTLVAAAITGFIWLYSYAVSVLDSALSFFKP
jgi:hypothetical protein